jgi:hypothetical protein
MNCCNAFGQCERGPGCPAGSRDPRNEREAHATLFNSQRQWLYIEDQTPEEYEVKVPHLIAGALVVIALGVLLGTALVFWR